MEASKKVWIRGNDSRKEEVIKMLTDLGATNPYNNDGHGKGKIIYFINHNNEIQPAYTGSEFIQIIKEEYKELTLPKKEHQFEPFDKVLVRDSDKHIWQIDFFSHKREGELYPFYTISSLHRQSIPYKQCIPYNEETKHLVGTADNW